MSVFPQKEPITKCDHCTLGKKIKKGSVKLLDRKFNKFRRGNANAKVLIVTSRYESDDYIYRFSTIIQNTGLYDYAILSGIECSVSDVSKNTSWREYKHCNAIDLSLLPNLQAVIVAGLGICAITKTSDLSIWHDFKEFLFNQTYFLTGISEERILPVYPVPYLDEILADGGFEGFFFRIQIKKVLEYLETTSNVN